MSKIEKVSKADKMALDLSESLDQTRDGKIKALEENGDYRKIVDRITNAQGRPIVRIELEKLVPAPEDWNFFPPLSPDKRLEMKLSVLANGLFSPIIVWEQENENYMILSGHNRFSVYKEILNEYEGEDIENLLLQAKDDETYALAENFNLDDYRTIEAIIFEREAIDEAKAKEIIIDTNYIQRDEDKKLLTTILMNRLDIVRSRRDLKGKAMNVVADEMGISASTVYRQWILANKISPSMRELYYSDQLTLSSILKVQNLSQEIQDWVVDTYGDRLNSNVMKKVSQKKKYTKADLTDLFNRLIREDRDNKKISVTIQVKEEWAEEFRKMAKKWIHNKTNRSEGEEE